MKLRNYVVLMVFSAVALMLVPLAPSRANWVYLGSDGSSGLPDSDGDETSGNGWLESWSYDVTGIDRGGDSGGSWAYASITSSEYVSVYSYGGTSASASADNPQPGVWGDSYYADIANPNYTEDGVTVYWDLNASGTVSVYGWVDDYQLGSGDSGYAGASADGSCGGHEYGYGAVGGQVYEFSTGSAWSYVGGYAQEDSSPSITQSSGYFSASLSFSVDAYGSDYVEDDPPGQAGPNQYTSAAGIYSGADASASISASIGYSGRADADAQVSFGGGATVSVTLP